MNKILLFMLLVSATILGACSKDDGAEPFSAEEGVITMTTEKKEISFELHAAKVIVITIDWGDGKIEEFTTIKEENEENDAGDMRCGVYPKHTYQNNKTHTIIVKGALTRLGCFHNQLTSLDVTKCTALIELECSGNQLTSLDVSKCMALDGLFCYDNQLMSLDISKHTALTELGCDNNQLTLLNISGCTVLKFLDCNNNKFSANALNKIFTDLPQGKTWEENGYTSQSPVSIGNNPGTVTCNKSIAENKGWEVRYN